MEQIYTDFTTKFLPQIQAGLTITKEYFLDLFSRYIHYLLIQDTFYLIGSFIFLICGLVLLKIGITECKKNGDENPQIFMPCFILAILGILFGIIGIFQNSTNLIQDKYIPEVRIYQELKSYQR